MVCYWDIWGPFRFLENKTLPSGPFKGIGEIVRVQGFGGC